MNEPPPDPERDVVAQPDTPSRGSEPDPSPAFDSIDPMGPSPSAAATVSPDAQTLDAAPQGERTPAPGRGTSSTDGALDGVIDRGQMKLVLARMFGRHRHTAFEIGGLTVLDQLGAGGMGVVYAAYDPKLDRKVAVKVLRPEVGSDPMVARARLLREAQTMARLTHPNVATVYEVGSTDDGIYLSMEFIRGSSLDTWLEQERRDWRQIVAVFEQAGHGLAAAHRAGIVHRDFKPHNVMIGRDGAVKVLDFGLARAEGTVEPHEPEASRDASGDPSLPEAGDKSEWALPETLTQTGAVLGTPAYMAPEQFLALPTTDKSDQFSFCVALYQGLYGQLPFRADSLPTLAAAILEGQVQSAPSDSSVPQWLRRVLLRGLSHEPEDRYPSMDALLADLGRDPAARRRRIVGGLAVTVVVGTGGFALARAMDDPGIAPPTCDGARTELADVWGVERRDAVRTTLTKTGPAGEQTWARVEPRLDAYAEAWIAMRDEACQTHRDAEQSDSMFDLRTACLDQRRAGLDALTELLVRGEGGEVERASMAAAGLPPIERCGDTVALAASVPPPDDADAASQVREQRERLARAKEHEDLGQLPAGLALADEAIETARALEYGPLEAEALLRRGSMLMEGGSPEDAEVALSGALLRGLAVDHPEVAFEALSKRMFMRGEWMRQVDRALEDRGVAEALFERIPHARRQYGVYLNNLATLLFRALDYDGARSTFERSLEVKREAFGPRHPELALTLANIGVFERGIGDPVGARDSFEDALGIATEALGPGHHLVLAMSSHLAETAIALQRPTDARARLEDIREIQESGPSGRLQETLVYLGLADLTDRRFERARAHFQRALELARASESPYLLVKPLHGLGLAHIGLGQIEQGLQRQQEAHAQVLAVMGADAPGSIHSHVRLAQGYGEAGMEQEALAHLATALELQERSGPADVNANAVLLPFATTAMRFGRAAEAESLASRGLALLEAAGVHRGPSVAELRQTRGIARLAMSDADGAIADLREAERLWSAVCEPDALPLAMTRFELARALVTASPSKTADALDRARRAKAALQAKGMAFREEARRVSLWLEQADDAP